MADATTRIRDVVNVTSGYPDPDNQVVGAAVLIDDRIGDGAPSTDFQHRPVFVVYVSKGAAKQAVAGRTEGTYLRNGTRVIYLPLAFPTVREPPMSKVWAPHCNEPVGKATPRRDGAHQAETFDTLLGQVIAWSQALAPLRQVTQVA